MRRRRDPLGRIIPFGFYFFLGPKSFSHSLGVNLNFGLLFSGVGFGRRFCAVAHEVRETSVASSLRLNRWLIVWLTEAAEQGAVVGVTFDLACFFQGLLSKLCVLTDGASVRLGSFFGVGGCAVTFAANGN